MNKLKNNKKGLDYAVLLALVILPLSLFFLVFRINGLIGETRYIGPTQFSMLNDAQEAEEIMLYIDQAAKNSIDLSLFQLASNGMFYDSSECGNYHLYPIWQTKDKECYPDIYSNFSSFFKDEFSKYLINYTRIKLPKDNYVVITSKTGVTGYPIKDLSLDINNKQSKIGSYLFSPYFTQKISFGDIEKSIEISKKIFNRCVDANETETCIDTEMISNNIADKWSFEFDNYIALFNVTTEKTVLVYGNNKLEQKELIIMFGLDFS